MTDLQLIQLDILDIQDKQKANIVLNVIILSGVFVTLYIVTKNYLETITINQKIK